MTTVAPGRSLPDIPAAPNPSAQAVLLARAYEEVRKVALVHSFEYRGRHTMVDPVTGVTFDLSPTAFLSAAALASRLSGDDLARSLEAIGVVEAEQLLHDILRLEAQGMFRRSALSSARFHEGAARAYLSQTPRKMMLLVSQTCNLRCVYCYAIEGNFADTGRLMSLARAQDAIRFLDRRSGRRRSMTVTLFGGEPLTNFAMIRDLVPWAKAYAASVGKRIHFTITTNGTLLSDEVIDFLIAHEFSVMVSLDGPRDVQNHNRPNVAGAGSFDLAAPRIQRLLERHQHPESIKVRATMTHQFHDTAALAGFFASFGFRRIGLGANVGFAFDKGPYDLTANDRDEIYCQTEALIHETGLARIRRYERAAYNPLASALLSLHKLKGKRGPKPKIGCGVGRNDQAVDVDGKLYPCHRYVGMTTYEIGNIYDGLDQRKLEEYYRRVLGAHAVCDDCWATRWCAGHCAQYLSHTAGHVVAPDTAACDTIRRNVERSIALYDLLSSEGLDWERLNNEVGED